MWNALLQTSGDPAVALARIVLGLVMFPHGAQHLLGWFGGYGYRGTMSWFASLGIPPVFGALAIFIEFLGSIALVFGLGGRFAAVGILGIMVVAALRVHLPVGFFMNWVGKQSGEGYEYHLLAATLALVVIVRGSGAWSLDRLIAGLS
jgi:putative oxidoreductase